MGVNAKRVVMGEGGLAGDKWRVGDVLTASVSRGGNDGYGFAV